MPGNNYQNNGNSNFPGRINPDGSFTIDSISTTGPGRTSIMSNVTFSPGSIILDGNGNRFTVPSRGAPTASSTAGSSARVEEARTAVEATRAAVNQLKRMLENRSLSADDRRELEDDLREEEKELRNAEKDLRDAESGSSGSRSGSTVINGNISYGDSRANNYTGRATSGNAHFSFTSSGEPTSAEEARRWANFGQRMGAMGARMGAEAAALAEAATRGPSRGPASRSGSTRNGNGNGPTVVSRDCAQM